MDSPNLKLLYHHTAVYANSHNNTFLLLSQPHCCLIVGTLMLLLCVKYDAVNDTWLLAVLNNPPQQDYPPLLRSHIMTCQATCTIVKTT